MDLNKYQSPFSLIGDGGRLVNAHSAHLAGLVVGLGFAYYLKKKMEEMRPVR